MSFTAGAFDPSRSLDCSRLTATNGASEHVIVERGPLRIALRGPPPALRGPLCLLDGVLDNPAAIAEELGCTWRTSEDLLVTGYRRWGHELLPRLRGDFALLLWDEQRSEGLLARDQLGVRSVFLCDAPMGVYFATEIHHLLAVLPKRPAPDPVGVAHWVAVRGRPGPGTLYAGIRRLNPGSALLMDRQGTREECYWAPRFSDSLVGPESRLEVRGALEQAVGRRLDPRAPTGVLMSGGLDSASVAAIAAEQAPGRVLAYSGVFPEHPSVDEAELVGELRNRLATGGLTAQVRSGGLIASALESLAVCGLPLAAWGDFWTLPLLRGARSEGVSTIIGGDGGDELFGVRAYLLADRVRAGRILGALELAREMPGAGDRPSRRDVARVFREFGLSGAMPYWAQSALLGRFAGREHPRWLLRSTIGDVRESADPVAWKRLEGPLWWAHLAHGLTRGVEETGFFEHQRLRAAMVGMEARHPLFDLELVELGLRMPPLESFDRHLSRPALREAMVGSLPDSVRLRPAKAWFDSLIVDCLNGPDRAGVVALLGDPGAELGAYVDLAAVKRMLLEIDPAILPDRFRWMHQVWRLVTAECWLRAEANPGATVLPRGVQASPARVALDRSSACEHEASPA